MSTVGATISDEFVDVDLGYIRGKDGKDGIDGIDGKDGIDGQQGDTGPQGPAGTMTNAVHATTTVIGVAQLDNDYLSGATDKAATPKALDDLRIYLENKVNIWESEHPPFDVSNPNPPDGWPDGVPWPPTQWVDPSSPTAPDGWPDGVPWPPTAGGGGGGGGGGGNINGVNNAIFYDKPGDYVFNFPEGVNTIYVTICGGGGGGSAGVTSNGAGARAGAGGAGSSIGTYSITAPVNRIMNIHIGKGGLGGSMSVAPNINPQNGEGSTLETSEFYVVVTGGQAADGINQGNGSMGSALFNVGIGGSGAVGLRYDGPLTGGTNGGGGGGGGSIGGGGAGGAEPLTSTGGTMSADIWRYMSETLEFTSPTSISGSNGIDITRLPGSGVGIVNFRIFPQLLGLFPYVFARSGGGPRVNTTPNADRSPFSRHGGHGTLGSGGGGGNGAWWHGTTQYTRGDGGNGGDGFCFIMWE